jgi:hypothetical protein
VRRQRPGPGRRCRRGLRRAGPAPGRWPDPGARAARRAAGRWWRWWPPAPRRSSAAACPCRLRARGGRLRGHTSRRRDRWRTGRTPGRAAGEQRDRGGVQAGAAVERGAFFVCQDADAGFGQGVDERFQPAAGSLDLGGGHLPGTGSEVLLERRRPLPGRAVRARGEPVERRPVRAPGGGRPARQAGHAERLDHVIVEQELPVGRDSAGAREPGQPPQRRGGHRLAPRAARGPAAPCGRRISHRIPFAGTQFPERIHLRNLGATDMPANRRPARRRYEILAGGRQCQHQMTAARTRPGRRSRRPSARSASACPAVSPSAVPAAASPAAPARPTRPARPLHPVDPHRQRQDRHPAPHPGPVRHLRPLVHQHPPAPRTDRRTGSPVPEGNGQGRRLGHDHAR